MVVGGEGSFAGGAGGPVVPYPCGQGEEALGDAGEHAGGGAAAVVLEAELAFQGLVDGLDPLSEAAEVAVAVVLVIASGLMLGSLTQLRRTDIGFNTDRLITLEMDLRSARYAGAASVAQFDSALLRELRATAGGGQWSAATERALRRTK